MRDAIGDYKVLERIGAGGAAEVFRARDTRLGRTAAIKVLTSEIAMDPIQGPAFVTEANLAVTLGHPSVAALYEIDEQDGRPHLVFEFVPGQTLSAVLAGHPLNPRRAIDFAAQVADGLAEVHAAGLVHRMLRPEKIIVTMKGTAKTIDVGLGQYAMAVARRTAVDGTPVAAMAYWAPEQIAGAPGDHRSDIWGLGLTLIEMLTGTPPVPGQPPSTSSLPPELRPLVARMVTEGPDRRPQSAATVAAELRAIAAAIDTRRDAVPSPPVAAVRKPVPAPAFPRWVLVLLVLVGAALVWFAAAG
jgi:serine/threonine protein kinase